MTNFFLLLLAIFLVFMNAFFVAAEFGMVKLRNTRVAIIKKSYGFRGRILAYIHQHLDVYLSACQLGITLASLGLGWVGEPALAHLLEPFFRLLHIKSPELIRLISFIIAFTLLSFLHIVIGELMPKSLAIRQPERVSVWTAVPLYIFYWVMYPAIWLLNACAFFLLRKMGLAETHHHEYFYSTDEIKLILSASHLHGELTTDETEILEQTLDFADLQVTEVMRPQEELVMLDVDQTIGNICTLITTTRYSRYPVYKKNKEEIIGVIHVKDLFAALCRLQSINSLQSLIRPVLKVTHSLPAIDLLRKFREGMPHLALVYRNKSLLGFVTLDNLLHALLGRIKDEFHRTQEDWILNSDGSLVVKGDCSLFSLERALDRDIEMNEKEEAEIETLSDLIFYRLGRIPRESESINLKEFKAVIKKMQGPRIMQVIIYPVNKFEEESKFLP